MAEVYETKLPGVGVRHDFVTEDGDRVGVIVHRSGRREIVVYDSEDPDACSPMLDLTSSDTRILGELLGSSQVVEAVGAVQHEIDGLAIEWIQLPDTSSAVGATIQDGTYRTRTGASIVAVVRGDTTVPAPTPDYRFDTGDTVVAVGTTDGLALLRGLMTG
ncbi:MAG: cation:proton antiporter regulatory subunit [Ilumatobacteraceae bacterium]|nr:cation:proton antiporter regulatory subunit [Ilumatobacteraceae bacterium]